MAEAAEDSTETLDKKWWSEDDDILLLTQANNDRPFLQRQATKAWEAMALTLRGAQNRFLLLMHQHKTRNETAARLSGAAEEETVKSRLLDDLASLFNDALVKRKEAAAVVDAAEKAEKVKFVREQAMQRGRRQSVSDSSDVAEPIVTSKRKMIMDAHEMEVALELEKFEFKRLKFERELEERAKGREEREK
ncbi:hypothetical protein H310_08076 [Aphanomyces invadans]|uniref:Myb-like domain-containing protein n=1 Tax=Aphanomyces invadans TaxID=157072 RepID=A0A024U184_9STRA|nr:hypothetical protein H310_08076 [Aphanomyces invadans]ETV99362.1 hypothetical protein H310_08076 [Aphanomyces invadans]|eukprot:XP_008871918.1 hypothetical protein H310_08076 [Aphanomyces invadans]